MTPGGSLQNLGVVVPAAGSGERMGGVQKVFLELDGKPLLERALDAFLRYPATRAIVVALPTGDARRPPGWLQDLDDRIRVVPGGRTRTESVSKALEHMDPDVTLVAVHDGARPFVDFEVLDGLVETATTGAAAVPGYPSGDTLKRIDPEGRVVATPNRDVHWQIQTPQVFPRDLLERAYARAVRDGRSATDDAHLVEQCGGTVRVLRGSRDNLKVTWPGDLALAEAILARRRRESATLQ